MDRKTSTTRRLFWLVLTLVAMALLQQAWLTAHAGTTDWPMVTNLFGTAFVLIGIAGPMPRAELRTPLVALGAGLLVAFLVLRVLSSAA